MAQAAAEHKPEKGLPPNASTPAPPDELAENKRSLGQWIRSAARAGWTITLYTIWRALLDKTMGR